MSPLQRGWDWLAETKMSVRAVMVGSLLVLGISSPSATGFAMRVVGTATSVDSIKLIQPKVDQRQDSTLAALSARLGRQEVVNEIMAMDACLKPGRARYERMKLRCDELGMSR